MHTSSELTPQERLAISRMAIVKHMHGHDLQVLDRIDNETDDPNNSGLGLHNKISIITHTIKVWWNRHPVNAVLELTRPLMSDYARAHPLKLLSIAMGVGVAIVLIKPWRMVSLGAVAVAAVKSSGISNALYAMLSSLSSVTRHPEKVSTTL